MTIQYRVSVSKQGDHNGSGTSASIDTTTSDFLVAVVCSFSIPTTPVVVADSQSNSWGSPVVTLDNGATITAIYAVVSPSTSAAHTFSANGTDTYASICVGAYSGVKQTSPTDQTNSGSVAANTVVQPGTQSGNDTGGITPSEDNCLLIYGASDAWTTSLSASSGTSRQTKPLDAGNSFANSLFDEIQTTATARNPRMTEGGVAVRMSGVIASFKPAIAGTTGLKLNSSLSGLGASGAFFHDRLARSILGWRPSLILPRRKVVLA